MKWQQEEFLGQTNLRDLAGISDTPSRTVLHGINFYSFFQKNQYYTSFLQNLVTINIMSANGIILREALLANIVAVVMIVVQAALYNNRTLVSRQDRALALLGGLINQIYRPD